MNSILKKRKSPCCLAAYTDFDSEMNLPLPSLNQERMSISSFKKLMIYPAELREAIRLARRAASTGGMRHLQALVPHLEGIAVRVVTLSRGGTRQ